MFPLVPGLLWSLSSFFEEVFGVAGDDSGVGAGSNVGCGVSDDAAGFVTGPAFGFFTSEVAAGLDSPDFGDFFFLRVTSVQPSWSFVLAWT